MDKPVSPPAVAHMTTVRIYLCVQGGGPSIHKQNLDKFKISNPSDLNRSNLDIHQIGSKDGETLPYYN